MDLTTKPVNVVEGLAHSAGQPAFAAQPPRSSGAVCGYCGGRGAIQIGVKGGFIQWAKCSACDGANRIRTK